MHGHCGAYGNELDDSYAKEARDSQDIEKVHFSLREAKGIIKRTGKEYIETYWLESEKGSITRKFFDTYSQLALVSQLSLNVSTVQLLSGHHRLNSFLLHKYKQIASPLCSFGQEEETLEHYLFRCERYSDIRLEWETTFSTTCAEFGRTAKNLLLLDKCVTLTKRFA